MLRELKQTLLERESLILIFVVALFCLMQYHGHFSLLPARCGRIGRCVTEAVAYLGAPLLFSLLVLRENPLDFGLGLGDWKTWGKWLALFVLVMAALILIVSRLDGRFADYYPVHKPARDSHAVFLRHALSTVFYMFAWEYFFRGFLLFSLEKRFGRFAVMLQMVPFVFVHFGKPELEVYSSILGAIILGVLALRTRSMWPCFLIHAFIAVWMDVCVVYVWGQAAVQPTG